MPKPKRPPAKSKPKPQPKASFRRPSQEGELGDRRRLELLEAAYELTAEKGMAGLRTRDVAKRAKVNISTLHYYFGTKQALVSALVDHTCAKFEPSSGRRRADSTESALAAHLADSWRAFEDSPKLEVVLEELSMHSRHSPEAKAAFRAVYQQWNAWIEQLLRADAAAGRVRADLDPKAGAFIVSSFIIGASVELGVDPRAFDYASVARELERWAAPGRKTKP